ncbi:MAG: hypothetical protein ABFS35_23550 [Bacteroidota bacterium]
MKKLAIIYKVFGILLELTAYGLAWYFYGWELSIVIFISAWANNIKNN